MHKPNDIIFRVGVVAVTFLISVTNSDAYSAFYMTSDHPLYGLLFVSLFWEINRAAMLKAYRRLLPNATMGKRILLVFCISYGITMPLRFLYFYGKVWFFADALPLTEAFIWNNLLNCIMSVWPFIATYEIVYVNRMARQIDQEKEDLKQANLQQQYDSLKGQVNPHFLFNNLNCLSTLVTKDVVKADQFIGQMSSVYRYLLRSNEANLTSLDEELQFIDSYNHLLKIRFGDGFQPAVTVDESARNFGIPPMTLQLLVENAVKHNVVSPEEPLRLRLYVQHDKLVVSNNVQKKTNAVPSNGIGLANIILKYQLLKLPAVEVRETEREFAVVLPLAKKEKFGT